MNWIGLDWIGSDPRPARIARVSGVQAGPRRVSGWRLEGARALSSGAESGHGPLACQASARAEDQSPNDDDGIISLIELDYSHVYAACPGASSPDEALN